MCHQSAQHEWAGPWKPNSTVVSQATGSTGCLCPIHMHSYPFIDGRPRLTRHQVFCPHGPFAGALSPPSHAPTLDHDDRVPLDVGRLGSAPRRQGCHKGRQSATRACRQASHTRTATVPLIISGGTACVVPLHLLQGRDTLHLREVLQVQVCIPCDAQQADLPSSGPERLGGWPTVALAM
jgi:hypothetical protein